MGRLDNSLAVFKIADFIDEIYKADLSDEDKKTLINQIICLIENGKLRLADELYFKAEGGLMSMWTRQPVGAFDSHVPTTFGCQECLEIMKRQFLVQDRGK